jgi:hypothetical protein
MPTETIWRLRSGFRLSLIAVAVSGWLLAGCGESRQDALNKLAAANRDVRAASGVIDERVAAGAFGYLPCVEMQLKAAALAREHQSLAPELRYRDEPATEVSAQMALDHAADLSSALTRCTADTAAERAVEDLLAGLNQTARRLSDSFNDYLKKTSSPVKEAVQSDIEHDDAEIR